MIPRTLRPGLHVLLRDALRRHDDEGVSWLIGELIVIGG